MPTLRNLTTGGIVADNVQRAKDLWQRIAGLIPYRGIRPNEGLWFDNCSAIHTIAMREPIDVIFLDKHDRVLRVAHSVPSFRLAVACFSARTVVELGAAASGVRDPLAGDKLVLE